MTPNPSPEAHLDPHDVAGYLAGTLDPAARQAVEAHLADCDDCTAELVAVRRLHRPSGRPIRWIGALAAAAAVIAVLVLQPRQAPRSDVTASPIRGDSSAAVTVTSPPDDATLSVPPTFTWRAVSGASAYRITVSTAEGDSVWAASLPDTSIRPPEGALSAGSGPYYWYVDVLLADGRSVAGTAHAFRLGP